MTLSYIRSSGPTSAGNETLSLDGWVDGHMTFQSFMVLIHFLTWFHPTEATKTTSLTYFPLPEMPACIYWRHEEGRILLNSSQINSVGR